MNALNLRVIPDYHCTNPELYGSGIIGWTNYSNHLSDFVAHKTTYNAGLTGTRKLEIQTASLIPGYAQRRKQAGLYRIELDEKAYIALAKWQALKCIIKQAFPKSQHKIMLEAAGSLYYTRALKRNWECLSALISYAMAFITENSTVLQSVGGMPTTFPTQLSTLASEMMVIYGNFKNSEQEIEIKTAEKTIANNLVYEHLMDMFKDGQVIYKNNYAVRNLFVFDHVLELVRGSSNVEKEFTIPAGESKTIKKIVAYSSVANIGTVPLYVCAGSNVCVPESSILVPADASVVVPEDSSTITVTNSSATTKGKFTARVVQK